jgi:hypothetical protein
VQIANTQAPATPTLLGVALPSLDSPDLPAVGFEPDFCPATVSIHVPGVEALVETTGFLVVVATKNEAQALERAEIATVAVDLRALPFYLKATRRAPATVERLGHKSGAVIFVLPAKTAHKSVEAVNAAVSILRASGVVARTYTVPRAHTDVCAWLLAAGADRVYSALGAAVERAKGTDNTNTLPGGYIPLAYEQGIYYVWSIDQAEVKQLHESKLEKSSELMSHVGNKYLWNPVNGLIQKSDKGVESINFRKLGGQIRDACILRGNWRSDRVRPAGVWLDDGELVVNSHNAYRVSDGSPLNRAGKRIYARGRELGVSPDTAVATVEDSQKVLKFLKGFNWKKRSKTKSGQLTGKDTDALLLLGTLFISYLCAALPHRPHTFVQADANSGKSVLLKFFRFMLGDAGISFSRSNGNGLRQSMKKAGACIACVLDESGSDSKQIATLLEYLRLAFDGSKMPKGTADHVGVEFEIRTIALVVGVIAPEMDAQDARRFLMHEMSPWEGAREANELYTPKNADSNPIVEQLGRKMFARALSHWPRLVSTIDALQRVVGVEGGAAETLLPSIAGCYVALHDEDLVDDAAAKAWLDKFDIEDQTARIQKTSVGVEFLDRLSSTIVKTGAAGFGADMSIGTLWDFAYDDTGPRGAWRRELGLHGMKMELDEEGNVRIGIHPTSGGFSRIVSAMKWKGGDAASLIMRIPGFSKETSKGKIGGTSTTYHTIPFEREIDPVTCDPVPLPELVDVNSKRR